MSLPLHSLKPLAAIAGTGSALMMAIAPAAEQAQSTFVSQMAQYLSGASTQAVLALILALAIGALAIKDHQQREMSRKLMDLMQSVASGYASLKEAIDDLKDWIRRGR